MNENIIQNAKAARLEAADELVKEFNRLSSLANLLGINLYVEGKNILLTSESFTSDIYGNIYVEGIEIDNLPF